MSTAAVAPAPAPVKKAVKKTTKPKFMANHPKYGEMICAAIKALHERGGSSRQAILKYIMANYPGVGKDSKTCSRHIKGAIRFMLKAKSLKQMKGSFGLGENKPVAKKVKKVKKPKAVKPKKVKAPKKTTTKKTTKKPATKKPKAVKKPTTKTIKPKTVKPKTVKKAPKTKKVTPPVPVAAN